MSQLQDAAAELVRPNLHELTPTEQHRELCRQAWQLRAKGLLLKDIAQEQRCYELTVQERIQWWRKNGDQDDNSHPTFRRALGVERTDQLRNQAAKLFDEGGLSFQQYVDIILKLDDRESKYLGLDAPQRQLVGVQQVNFTVDGVDPKDLT